MLEMILKHIKNWFRVRDKNDGKYPDTYTISDGKIILPFLLDGQYFRIIGSRLNDGLYIYGDEIRGSDNNVLTLNDETFEGAIWALAIPKAFLDLVKEISEWQTKYGAVVSSPYTSENYFGQYSYTKAAGGSTSSGGAGGWESVFASRLNDYRKIMED